jgi:hypothetical protein
VVSDTNLKALRRLYDVAESQVRGLKSLGVALETYGTLLSFMLLPRRFISLPVVTLVVGIGSSIHCWRCSKKKCKGYNSQTKNHDRKFQYSVDWEYLLLLPPASSVSCLQGCRICGREETYTLSGRQVLLVSEAGSHFRIELRESHRYHQGQIRTSPVAVDHVVVIHSKD